MPRVDQKSRSATASRAAKAAEDRGDVVAATEWRRYRLIEDVARDPEDLLAG